MSQLLHTHLEWSIVMLFWDFVFTGEDCTSAFQGKGKVGPLKKLQRNPRFLKTFQNLGEDWTVKSELHEELEEFTCLMYGY